MTKQLSISEKVHRQLKLFTVQEGFKTLDAGIAELLRRAKVSE